VSSGRSRAIGEILGAPSHRDHASSIPNVGRKTGDRILPGASGEVTSETMRAVIWFSTCVASTQLSASGEHFARSSRH